MYNQPPATVVDQDSHLPTPPPPSPPTPAPQVALTLIEKETLSPDTRRFRFGLPSRRHRLGLPIGARPMVNFFFPPMVVDASLPLVRSNQCLMGGHGLRQVNSPGREGGAMGLPSRRRRLGLPVGARRGLSADNSFFSQWWSRPPAH